MKCKSKIACLLFSFYCMVTVVSASAQTTSWTGASNTGWHVSANWTNGVPNSSIDAIIGDEHHTGLNNPVATGSINAKTIVLGSTKTASITLSNAKSHLTLSGSLTIGTFGTLNHTSSTIKIAGNWSNSGTYVPATANNSKKAPPTVIFTGTDQTITGSTSFMGLTINQGSTTTIQTPITITAALSVSGTLDPGSNLLTLSGSTFTVASSGIVKVKATDFSGNYSIAPSTLHTGGTIDYAASDRAQNIAAFSSTRPFSVLVISGGTTKTLTSNIALSAASTSDGQLLINAGTLNLSTFTANRATTNVGGTISVANGATLRIGGTNTLPANYAERTFGTTSTVEYSGTNQTVSSEAYGNLLLSASSGTPTKTLATTAMIITGDLISTLGAGTALTVTAGNSLTVHGNIVIGASTTFNGGNFTHTLDGDWINNGTFNSGTSTIGLRGTTKNIAGASHTTFNNLSLSGNITGKAPSITVAGNLSVSGAGTFIHAAESNNAPAAGTFTMSGAGKTISGQGYTFENLTVSGTISSASDLTIRGNLSVPNTTTDAFNLTGGTLHLSGSGKTLSTGAAGSLNLHSVHMIGSVTTGSSFRIKADLTGHGQLTATAGTITFTGTSTYAGKYNLFNVTLNGSKLQLSASATLGIAGNLTLTSGTFDVSTTSPNTVEYNGGNQNITGTTYHHITLAGTGTKTAVAGVTVNGNLQINSKVTFAAGNFTHSILGNWVNNGAFNASTGTIRLTGGFDASITGTTTFSTLTLEKASSTNTIVLNSDVNVSTINMLTGAMQTRARVLTITNTRTGTGIIHGTITRAHAFTAGVTYDFSGINNTITFGTVSNINSVTLKVVAGSSVSNFPSGGAINRLYTITIPSGTYSNATWRMPFRPAELNGNTEEDLNIFHNTGTTWIPIEKSADGVGIGSRWLEATGLSSLNGGWTLSNFNTIAQWKGTTSQDWHTASNWVIEGSTTERVPLSNDIVEIGVIPFTHQPIISANAVAKSIQFGSASPATLTLAGGDLTVAGNINGLWTGNATHTLAVGDQTLIIGGDLELSEGVSGQDINLTIGSGTLKVEQSLTQSGNAAITFTGAGNLIIGADYFYTSGMFTAGTGAVTYLGNNSQVVAGNISYNHLVIDKSAGVATASETVVTKNLSLQAASVLLAEGSFKVTGNINIGSGTTLNGGASTHEIEGNWTNNGTYVPSSGTVKFNGTGPQTVNATTFNQLLIEKTSGTLTLTGNLVLNANVSIVAGAVDLQAFSLNRSAAGGKFSMAANTALYLAGTANFPANFNAKTLDIASNVYYTSAGTQNVAGISYGNLVFQNGGTNPKTLEGATTVKGNLTINSGSTLQTGGFTVTAAGDITNNGTINPGTGTFTLTGTSKTMYGKFNMYNLTITGSYTMVSDTLRIQNDFYNSGSVVAGNNICFFSGNVTNTGHMSTDGTIIYTGMRQQTVRLLGTMASTAAGKTIFNGTVAPVLNSNSAPTFVTVIVNNTAGISSSIGWTVHGLFQVNAGSSFNGGIYTHNFFGPFVNEGSVTSSGVLNFSPSTDRTLALGTAFNSTGTVYFGGSGKITLTTSPQNLKNIEIANTNAAGVTAPHGWNISNNLKINQSSVFNGGTAHEHAIMGAFINNGTFNGNSSTFTFSTINASVSGSGVNNFHHLVINDSTTVLADINIKGNLTTNGILNLEYNQVHFNGITAQEITGTKETNFYELFISNNTATVSVLKNMNIEHSLVLGPGGVLKPSPEVVVNSVGPAGTLTGTGTIEVTRILAPADYLNQYAFSIYDLKTLTVKFSGTQAQSSSLTTFHNLTISNPEGFILTAPTSINGTLLLENSNLHCNGHLLTVGSSTTATGNIAISGSGFVVGKLKRWLPASAGTSIQFPVGHNTTRRLATVQYTVAPSGGTLTAEFVSNIPGTSGLPLRQTNSNEVDYVISKTGTSGYWNLTAGATGSETLTGGVYNATFEATNFEGISQLTNFVVLKRANQTQPWSLEGTHVTASGTNSSPIISRTGLSGFSDFVIGGEEVTPLPVTLAGFRARRNGNNATLTWKTVTEINNAGFFIEVSSDGQSFRTIGFVKSDNTNSSTEQQYSFIDKEVGKSGVRYYRLLQQDIDGQSTYSVVRALSFTSGTETIAVFPNPFINQFEVSIEVTALQFAQMTLYDLNGKEIWKDSKTLIKGNNQLAVAIPDKLVQGTYLLKVRTDQTIQTFKMVKE